ncbi:MAG: hypothetical protein WBP64_14235 [Nitrososphaeraceae archaeon]
MSPGYHFHKVEYLILTQQIRLFVYGKAFTAATNAVPNLNNP